MHAKSSVFLVCIERNTQTQVVALFVHWHYNRVIMKTLSATTFQATLVAMVAAFVLRARG